MILEDIYRILGIPVMGDLVEYKVEWYSGVHTLRHIFDDAIIDISYVPWKDMFHLYEHFQSLLDRLIYFMSPKRRSKGFSIIWGIVLESMLAH